MHGLALEVAGALAIFAGLLHGMLGETRVFPRARIDPPWARRLFRAVWLCSAIAWIGGGVLLMAAASFAAAPRHWIVFVLVAVNGSAAIGNAVASRGRHFGWMVFAAVVVLSLAGL